MHHNYPDVIKLLIRNTAAVIVRLVPAYQRTFSWNKITVTSYINHKYVMVFSH